MTTPLAEAHPGEVWMWQGPSYFGAPQRRRLVIVEYGGEPWVTWDYMPIAPVVDFPPENFNWPGGGSYEREEGYSG